MTTMLKSKLWNVKSAFRLFGGMPTEDNECVPHYRVTCLQMAR